MCDMCLCFGWLVAHCPLLKPEWSPAELERYLHVVAMERHAAGAIGRREVLDVLHAHLGAVGNPNPLVLTGPSGSGKSTVIATLLSELQASSAGAGLGASPGPSGGAVENAANTEPFVLHHTFGLAGQSNDFRRVLLRMCAELKLRFNIYIDLPTHLADVATALPRFLAHAALFGRVILVMDALEKADMYGLEEADWLPLSLPLAVRVLISAGRCRALIALRERCAALLTEVDMPLLTDEERKGIINKSLATVGGGQLGVGQLGHLLEKDDAGNPLYLLVATEVSQRKLTLLTLA